MSYPIKVLKKRINNPKSTPIIVDNQYADIITGNTSKRYAGLITYLSIPLLFASIILWSVLVIVPVVQNKDISASVTTDKFSEFYNSAGIKFLDETKSDSKYQVYTIDTTQYTMDQLTQFLSEIPNVEEVSVESNKMTILVDKPEA